MEILQSAAFLFVRQVIPKTLHRAPDPVDNVLPCLWSFLKHRALTIGQLSADVVQLWIGLGSVPGCGLHLIPLGETVLKHAEHPPLFALYPVVLGGEFATQDEDGQQQGMGDRSRTRFQVVENALESVGLHGFDIARCDSRLERVREHQLPTSGGAFPLSIGFPEDEFWVGVVSKEVGG